MGLCAYCLVLVEQLPRLVVVVWVVGGVAVLPVVRRRRWYVFCFYLLFVIKDWVVEDFWPYVVDGFKNPKGSGSDNPKGSGY
jgi:hypothetical protein